MTVDGVRGYLALAVLCHHFVLNWNFARGLPWGDPELTLFRNMGPVPVSMFFMITAFLFYGKLVRSGGRLGWARLYLGRVLRLTPMYIVSIAALLLIVGWHTGFAATVPVPELAHDAARWLGFTLAGDPDLNGYAKTFVIIAGVTWTLRYEWVFYLCLPLIALAGRSLSLSPAVRMLLLGAIAVYLEVLPTIELGFLSSKLAIPFCLGMLACELHALPRLARFATSTRASMLAAVLLALSLLLPLPAYGFLQVLLVAGAFLLIVSGTSLFGVLRQPFSLAVGDASYSIYLLHGLLLHLLFAGLAALRIDLASPALWVLLPVIMVIVVALSLCTYRWIERPFIDLGKRRIAATPPVALLAAPAR